MCGLNAIFAYGQGAPPIARGELVATREAMHRRGPDGDGIWVSPDGRIGLAHKRLAIIGLLTGRQPMADAAGRLRIVFNGEIYNYPELRRGLEQEGAVFVTDSDTEVLLHLYARRGPEMVRELRGMYAFVLWDEAAQGIFMARDPFGIKPLYLADDGATIRIASQVKALRAGGAPDGGADPAGHVGFLLLGSIPEPFTLYRGIAALPSGSSLWIDRQGRRIARQFFDLPSEIAAAEAAAAAPLSAAGATGAALLDSVRHHLLADVPVGVFLSAGIDSGTLLSLAVEVDGEQPLDAITLGFEEYRGTIDDEAPLAERMAHHLRVAHRLSWVRAGDFHAEHDALFAAMDQPTIDGINMYFVSRAAARRGLKVALCGTGGDEVFGGYPSFAQIPRMVGALAPLRAVAPFGRAVRGMLAPLVDKLASPKYAGVLEYGTSFEAAYLLRYGVFMPWELGGVVDRDFARAGLDRLQPLALLRRSHAPIRSPRMKVAALELQWFLRHQLLRDADWAGMAHSLEIRVPLVDVELFRRLLPFLVRAPSLNKRDLAASPRRSLPPEILHRPKTGFSVPVRGWLAEGRLKDRSRSGRRSWAHHVYSMFAEPAAASG